VRFSAHFQELNPAPIPNLHRRSKTLPGLQARRAQLAAAFMSRTHPAGSRLTPDCFPTPCGLPEFAPQPSLAVKLQGLPRDLKEEPRMTEKSCRVCPGPKGQHPPGLAGIPVVPTLTDVLVLTLLAGNPIAPQIFREAYNSTILSSRHSSDTSQAFHGHNH
jgi:hypothetical protein